MNTYAIFYTKNEAGSEGVVTLSAPDDRTAWDYFARANDHGRIVESVKRMTRVFVDGVKVDEDVLLWPKGLGEGPVDVESDVVPVCECGRTWCEAHR